MKSTEFDGLVAAHAILAGRYRVDSMLGVGGMAAVVAATDIERGEPVAVKLLYSQIASSPEMRERFVNEVRSAARLSGPHVARVHGAGTLDGGTPYMVMERLDGTDLGRMLAESHFSIDLAVEYILQTCEALAEAHAAGIVHRDIKPDNLFVASQPDGSSVLKVLDFGISIGPAKQRITSTNSVLGTPAYMPPEQMRSARLVDARSDIWSIGAVLYELIEGSSPFSADSYAALCVEVAYHEPIAMQQPVPPGLVRAIHRCLQKEPEARWQSVAALAHALLPYSGVPAQAAARLRRIAMYGIAPAVAPSAPSNAVAVAAIRDARERVAMPALLLSTSEWRRLR